MPASHPSTYSESEIAQVKQSADLRSVVGEFVQLTRKGKDWVGLCPFHKEDTPSFKVDPKGFYKCFGCGAGGDVIKFLQEIKGDAFPTVIKELAEQYRVQLNGSAKKIIATYDYTDEQGALLFQVVRYEPKDFRQRRADGTWGLGDTRRVLFNLPAVVKSDRICLVEGERDVISLIARGFVATCNPMGAGKWDPSYTESLRGKAVMIVPDNDAPGRKHAYNVAKELLPAAKLVMLREIPAPSKDVTDWLATGKALTDIPGKPTILTPEILASWAEQHHLIESQQSSTLPNFASVIRYLPKGEGKVTSNQMYMSLLQHQAIMTERTGKVWHWNSTRWEDIHERQLGAWLLEYDNQEKPKTTRQREAADLALKAVYMESVPWRSIAHFEVPCLNGVVNIDDSSVRPHRKEDYMDIVIPHAYDPHSKHPRWISVLEDFFGEATGDVCGQQKIDVLQEFFGYCLLPHTRFKKALFLWGESDSGKSIIAEVLGYLVGIDNRCVIDTDAMADPRKREDIVGKLINVLTELPTDAMIQDGGFKQLVSTGDPISIDPKYKHSYSYTPVCKHIIVCNSLPEINDHTRGTTNRLLLIHFLRIFAKAEQNKHLIDHLKLELPGILAWAVEGAARLVSNNGEFTEIPESQNLIETYRAEQNPVTTFIEERTDEDGEIPMDEFRAEFNKWSGRPYTPRKIGMMLSQAGLRITVGKRAGRSIRVLDGRHWVGRVPGL